MTPDEFGESVSEVIHATLKVYIEVNNLLRDVRAQVQETMACLPLSSIAEGDQALTLLRGWRGFLAAPGLSESKQRKSDAPVGADEEEKEPGNGDGRVLRLHGGAALMFGKFVLHDFPRRVQPCFVGGVLSAASVSGSLEPVQPATFTFKSVYGRRILDEMSRTRWVDGGVDIVTKARIHIPGAARKKGRHHRQPLQFRLQQEPIERSLLELDGRDSARELTTALFAQWKALQRPVAA